MAKVNFKGLVRVNKLIKKVLSEDVFTNKLVKEIGEFSEERVRAFTRSGFSISGEKKKRLKKLSESYKNMRRGALKYRTINGNVVALPGPDERLKQVDREFFDPDFSNLTFSGQLLKSIKYFFDRKKRRFTIKPTGKRKKLAGESRSLTNQQVAKFVAEQGREFIGIDKKGVTTIKNMIRKEIRTQLRKNNLRK